MKNLKVSNVLVPFLVLLGASATACGGGESGDDAGTGATAGTGGSTAGTAGTGGSASGAGGGAGTGGSTACAAAVTASPANNYTFSSTLTFPAVSVQPDTELSFDWSAVTKDFLGHDVDPMADVDQVTLLMWSLTLEELQTKLNADDLAQRELTTVPATLFTEKMVTSGDMLDFTLAGNPVLPEEIMPFFSATEYPPAEHTYTVMVASGTVLGKGTRMIQSFRLDPASTNTNVVVTANSTTLDYDVDLLSLTPTAVPAGTAAVTIDWSGMTVNAHGLEFRPTDITSVLIGRYTETPTELQTRFLDLDMLAEDLYRAEVPSGTSIDLSAAVTDSGQAFTGVDGTSTWVLSLVCGDCNNPAPWYLTFLEPCN